MVELFSKKSTKVGAKPGTLVIDKHTGKPTINIIRYTRDSVNLRRVESIDEIKEEHAAEGIVWIDIQGMGDETLIRAIAELFSIHPLALEDVVNTPQRPKTDTYETHQMYISRMVKIGESHDLEHEQVSIFFGSDYVLTFQEREGDVFDPVRKRLQSKKGPMRTKGTDYLAYAIIDAIVDGYFPVLEQYSEFLESLESKVIAGATPEMLEQINRVKRNLLVLRRGIWPQRDAINSMIRDESAFISDGVKIFLRDCYNHCVQITDVLETFRETAGALLTTYLSALGIKQNEVMRILTIVSSIFIPLTFMAGIYGMNFEAMPELKHHLAYPI